MPQYGVIGRVLSHSWSPQIHKNLASYDYQKYELEPGELETFLTNTDWQGLNVTMPYKKDVLTWASSITPVAKRLGAANTLVRKADGSYIADNTDLYGFTYMLKRFCTRYLGSQDALQGTEALVLGSGGAAQAIEAALCDLGAKPSIISRSGADSYATILTKHKSAEIIVNTTPVGMYPNCPDSPLSLEVMKQLPKLKGVLDAVYNPYRTGIMLQAEKLSIPAESGLVMLVAQAFRSSEIWLNTTYDEARIDSIEQQLLAKMRNIVLIGMPGCGKTSTGRELAKLCGRKHIDLDIAFKGTYNKSAAEVIEQSGEATFRGLETKIIKEYCSKSGLIISCGGGVVTRPENYDLMHQNGTIVMIDRPISELSVKGRPLSAAKGVERLAQERMPLYRAWADTIQGTTGSAKGDALAIAQLLGL